MHNCVFPENVFKKINWMCFPATPGSTTRRSPPTRSWEAESARCRQITSSTRSTSWSRGDLLIYWIIFGKWIAFKSISGQWMTPPRAGTVPSITRTATTSCGTGTWSFGNSFFKMNGKLNVLQLLIFINSFYGAGNCKWWHFYPDERLPALEEKFNEIMDTHKSGERIKDSKKKTLKFPQISGKKSVLLNQVTLANHCILLNSCNLIQFVFK